jgi:hypothetical protein
VVCRRHNTIVDIVRPLVLRLGLIRHSVIR